MLPSRNRIESKLGPAAFLAVWTSCPLTPCASQTADFPSVLGRLRSPLLGIRNTALRKHGCGHIYTLKTLYVSACACVCVHTHYVLWFSC